MHTFLIALVTGLWTGSALLLFAVIRSPRDLVLRYFALVVLLLAPQQTWAIDEYSTPTLARLAINVLGLGAAFGKVCLFIYFPVAVGFGIFFAGAMTPVFVEAFWAIPLAVLQLTEYRMMGTLWGALRGEFPKMNLRRQWRIHRRYYRRGVEIRDGLVLLKDYYNADVAEVAEQASRNRGEDVAVTAMVVAAALVREALKAHQEGRLPERRHAVPTSGASDWATDTAWIISLARAFASSTPTAPPPAAFSALSCAARKLVVAAQKCCTAYL